MKKTLIGLILCSLMMLSTAVPATATTEPKTASHPLTTGNTLYVGGSGPNNYTKIQDAINDAITGDTVFVYDESSPYWENLYVTKSITLNGEDRNTTIINGKNNGETILIKGDSVTIKGFTIQHGGWLGWWKKEGILIRGNSSTIQGNIIQNNYNGIALTNGPGFYQPHHHLIINNIIRSNRLIGITSRIGIINSNISGNYITDNGEYGIGLSGTISSENTIIHNIISGNHNHGIVLVGTRNTIVENTVQNHTRLMGLRGIGIEIIGSNNSIIRNNLINNSRHAFQKEYAQNSADVGNKTKENNVWDANYWGQLLAEPKRIDGRVFYERRMFISLSVPWFAFDTHPAQEPYDIPSMGV